MSALNSFQRIDRVITGRPFGNGSDGAYSSATIPTLTKDSCSGTATSTTLTTAGSTFANNDILLIHQSRGTGAGQWEINKVTSGGGTTSLTLMKALQYTYTDSGASQAQATKIPQYTNVTVQSGTWTVPSWDGNTGGILVFASNGIVTVTGTNTASGKGFVGATGITALPNSPLTGSTGEGTSGSSVATQTSANGSGGGGGTRTQTGGSSAGAGGGGGGNVSAGSNGTQGSYSGTPGTGGGLSSSSDLITLNLGGGGGGSGSYDSLAGASGGNGAGAVIIFAKSIAEITGSIVATGSNGGDALGGGGGGAGGSVLIVCKTAILGTNKVTALAGSGGSGGVNGGVGGNGSNGAVAVHHSGTVTGTTNPSFDDTTETTLVETDSGFLMNFI